MERKPSILWDLTRGQRGRYAFGLLAMCCATGLLYLVPLVTRGAIDALLDPDPKTSGRAQRVIRIIDAIAGAHAGISTKLAAAGALILALMGAQGLFSLIRGRVTAVASETIAINLRKRLYDQLQHLPSAYHDKAQTGDLVQRCSSDVDTIRQFFGTQIIEVQRAGVLIVVVVPLLLWLDWKQGLIALALMPLMVGFAIVFFAKVRGTFKAVDEAEGAMTSVLQENLTGIRVVRAFARHDFEKQKFGEKNANYRRLNFRLIQLLAIYWSTSDFFVFVQMALVLLTGATRVMHRTLSVGDLVAFQTYVGMYVFPLRQMARVVSELGKASISAGRVREILEQPRESTPAEVAALPQHITGQIEIEHLSFAHAGKPVLQDVTLSIAAGETLAILGPSGSGKSTLIHLLLRLYDYEHGSIRLDGIELNRLDRADVRRQFGLVMQEPFLFSKTLRDNIRLGQHQAEEESIIEAAQSACIHESIAGFDKKYDTLVGERGVTLSGGQRQRVAIARALLVDAPILVLDDALSAVDTHTETQIREALRSRRGRQTTLLIAHRLSTIMHADRIIVLEAGRITQAGSHDELVAVDGLYRRLWQIQGELEDDLRNELEERSAAHSTHPDTDVVRN